MTHVMIKLTDDAGMRIGSCSIPAEVFDDLHKIGYREFNFCEQYGALLPHGYRPDFLPGELDQKIYLYRCMLKRSYQVHGFYVLQGLDPEKLDLIPGFAFHPNAAYIMAQIAKSPIVVKMPACQPSAT